MTAHPPAPPDVFVTGAELGGALVDVAVRAGAVAAIRPAGGDGGPATVATLDAGGGALLPGLHDHHVHLLATAAALDSVPCGPPAVRTAGELAATLRAAGAAARPGTWLRGVGYHERVAGDLDRTWLDALGIDRPVRIQHRSGAMWVLNSAAIAAAGIGDDAPAGVERDGAGRPTGRIHRSDTWLRARVPARPLDLGAVGRRLASFGVTGVTDMTPTSSPDELALLARAAADGTLPLAVTVTGSADLAAVRPDAVAVGPVKVVIEDHALPAIGDLVGWFRAARAHDRAVAAHCVSRAALVLALVAWQEVGARSGDRIEHGAVIGPDLVPLIVELGLTVVTQPGFVATRGDDYLRDVDADELPDLWRCRTLVDAGVPVGIGTDTPFGDPDPWRSIAAAAARTTPSGHVVGAEERITHDRALAMFLGAPGNPASPREVRVGGRADLCLLDRPLADAVAEPTSDAVVITLSAGRIVHSRA